jgi:hypothetical protein
MFIPDPDFYPSRIPYPKTARKERGENFFFFFIFFCSHKYYKIENYLIFELVKKKVLTNLQRIIRTFYSKIEKIVFKLSKVRIGLGSGIRKKPIPDPGSRGQKGTRSRIPDPDPQL